MRRPDDPGSRIAIIGAGVAGLVSAYLLRRRHDVTVFEANDYPGGHTNTVTVQCGARSFEVDTGFIVFNRPNYPGFDRLLDELRVESQLSDMSFGVRCDRTGLEYRGSSLNTLFAQRRNLFRPSFHRLVRDIMRFFREAPELLERPEDDQTLGEYLDRGGYSEEFTDRHIIPMAAALWSMAPGRVRDFPAGHLVRFLANHRMLQVRGRPDWRTVRGGSRRYVQALTRDFRDRIYLGTPVRGLARGRQRVSVALKTGAVETFDHVVVATHADQALALLDDATGREREVLGAFTFQENDTVLHTDRAVMPRTRRAWASWNYHVPRAPRERPSVTYHMNRLQNLDAPVDYFVSLNTGDRIRDADVIRRITYHHPTYTRAAVAAQLRHREIINRNRTSFCGAYWGFGFHEDGVQSAMAVARALGSGPESEPGSDLDHEAGVAGGPGGEA